MAAPNLVNVVTITGKTDTFTLTNRLTTSLVVNAAGSDDVYKINSIVAANTTTATKTVTLAVPGCTLKAGCVVLIVVIFPNEYVAVGPVNPAFNVPLGILLL